MISPGQTIGILGGGQIGRMLAQAAEQLGYRVHVYEPLENSVAGEVSACEVNAPYTDIDRLKEYVRSCAVVTYAFENIPAEPLWEIEKLVLLRPQLHLLEICQNRMREKNWLRKNGLPHVPFTEVEAGDELEGGIRRISIPCVVKTADSGSGGRGQLKVVDDASLARAVTAFTKKRAVVERYIDFKCELSVIVARTKAGEGRVFPVAENIHTKSILDFSIVPARITEAVRVEAENLARAVADKFGVVGVIAIELFLTDRGELLINEVVPHAHDSGHYSLDVCETSQFEQHIRAICELPLGDVQQSSPVVTVNILGDAWKWKEGKVAGDPDWEAILGVSGAKLHLYGKRDPRIGRKMGHFSVTAPTVAKALERARDLKARLTHSRQSD